MRIRLSFLLGFAVAAPLLQANPADDAYIKRKLVEGINSSPTPETELQIREGIMASLRQKLEDILSASNLVKREVDEDRPNAEVARAFNVVADNIQWFCSELVRLYLLIKAQNATSGNTAAPSLSEALTDLAPLGNAVHVSMKELNEALALKPDYSHDADINAAGTRMTAAVNAFKTLTAQADKQ
jgi:hypothetical protein